MSLNRVIGRGAVIPWHLPADLKWFKKMTMGGIVVMGRRTFESIGRVLPGRATVVLSRSGRAYPGAQTVADLSQIPWRQEHRPIFLCGGAQVYAQTLPHCSDLYLTIVKRHVEGDVLFPPFEDAFGLVAELTDQPEFCIRHYRNRAAPQLAESTTSATAPGSSPLCP